MIWKILYLKWSEPAIGVYRQPKMFLILQIGVLVNHFSFPPRSLQLLVSNTSILHMITYLYKASQIYPTALQYIIHRDYYNYVQHSNKILISV